jgi:cytochrome c oxidase subunit III
VKREAVLDVSALPITAFGARSPLWWGVLLLVTIEATMMSLLLVSMLHLRGNYDVWPPAGVGDTVFRLAVAQLVLVVASMVPGVLAQRYARQERMRPARLMLLLATLVGVAALVLRVLEIRALPFRWDAHAYGSIFWMILGLHTAHVSGGLVENLLPLAILYRGPVEKKHLEDVEASMVLWYLVVVEWVPAFAVMYLAPIYFSR